MGWITGFGVFKMRNGKGKRKESKRRQVLFSKWGGSPCPGVNEKGNKRGGEKLDEKKMAGKIILRQSFKKF